MTTTTIRLINMTFEYPGALETIFDGVTLDMDTSWRLGLIGRNGRGKTTLLQLLHGKVNPTGGSIEMPVETEHFPYDVENGDKKGLAYVLDAAGPYRELEAEINRLVKNSDPESIRRYGEVLSAFEALEGYTIEARIQKEVQLMHMDPSVLERPVEQLSGGERTKLQIIALFLKPNRFLLIDEPTNHLDLEGRAELAAYMRKKSGYILVSHDQAFVDECCDHILSINKQGIGLTRGTFSTWEENKRREEEGELRKKVKLQKEAKRLEAAAKEARKWSGIEEKNKIGAGDKGFVGAQAARMMKRALQIESRRKRELEQVEDMLQEYEAIRRLELRQNTIQTGAYMKLYDVCFGYDERTLINRLTLDIQPGDRVWIKGCNGSGKSTLMNLLSGELEPTTGRLWKHQDVRVARAWQDMPWRKGSVEAYVEALGCDMTGFLRMLDYFNMAPSYLNRHIETLSEGERKKLDIARAFSSNWELYLWDEPLNYMDYNFRVQLEQAILKYEPTLVFVEHDKRFGEKVATKILDLDTMTLVEHTCTQ